MDAFMGQFMKKVRGLQPAFTTASIANVVIREIAELGWEQRRNSSVIMKDRKAYRVLLTICRPA
jgi:hypothetical protein